MKQLAILLTLFAVVTGTQAGLDSVAHDNASNYTNWISGSNGGAGLDNWLFRLSGTSDGHKGGFLATTTGNPDLDNVWSKPGFKAWGTFANGGSERQNFVAFRGFGWDGNTWANKLDIPLDTFRLSMENSGVDETQPGLVGFALRNGNTDGLTSHYDANLRFEFGFKGGQTNYYIIDGSGTVDTGLAWRDSGLHLTLAMDTNDMYRFTVTDAVTGSSSNFMGALTGSGSIDSVALFNRDSFANGNVYFNRMQILEFREPTVLIVR